MYTFCSPFATRTLGGSGGGFPVVEVDKAFFGGRDRMGHDDKTIVLGMMERKGEVLTRIVKSRRVKDVVPTIINRVGRAGNPGLY
jgi:transposase